MRNTTVLIDSQKRLAVISLPKDLKLFESTQITYAVNITESVLNENFASATS